MIAEKVVCAFDLGASGGKVFVSVFDGSGISLKEVYRFSNGPIFHNGRLCWDLSYLYQQLERGLTAAFDYANNIDGISVDSWGFDYVSYDQQGNADRYPQSYRGHATGFLIERLSEEQIYAATGIPPSTYTTRVQLAHQMQSRQEKPRRILWMPDAMLHWLGGAACTEQTIASTAQMLQVDGEAWVQTILSDLELQPSVFAPLVKTGTITGILRKELQRGTRKTHLIASAGHDTAAAVAGLPVSEPEFLYLICGTWSLLGAQSEKRYTDAKSLRYGLHNQRAANGKNRLQKGITGLWLCQQLRESWESEMNKINYQEQEALCQKAVPLQSLIDPQWSAFRQPGGMRQKIIEYCRDTGQTVLDTFGEQLRCIYESLALCIRQGIRELETTTGNHYDAIYFAGGGAHSEVLLQLIADATNKKLRIGFPDASALGNTLIQLVTLGAIPDLDIAGNLAREQFQTKLVNPVAPKQWDAVEARFEKMVHTMLNH